jgi:hypothetical protein
MANEIISYMEMCQREGVSLQRGMNYHIGANHSVILMSIRVNAPYEDKIDDDGSTIIYEGHDVPRSLQNPDPKIIDQPKYSPSGNLTENGKFDKAAHDFKNNIRQPERVRVYEKIKSGIWSYNGVFHLVDSWQEQIHGRNVFKFKLRAVEGEEDFSKPIPIEIKIRRVFLHPLNLKFGNGMEVDVQYVGLPKIYILIILFHGLKGVHRALLTTFNYYVGNTI